MDGCSYYLIEKQHIFDKNLKQDIIIILFVRNRCGLKDIFPRAILNYIFICMPPATWVRDKLKNNLTLGGYFKVNAFVSTMVHLFWPGSHPPVILAYSGRHI